MAFILVLFYFKSKNILISHDSGWAIIGDIKSLALIFIKEFHFNYPVVDDDSLYDCSTGLRGSSCCRAIKLFSSITLQIHDKFPQWSWKKEVLSCKQSMEISPYADITILSFYITPL